MIFLSKTNFKVLQTNEIDIARIFYCLGFFRVSEGLFLKLSYFEIVLISKLPRFQNLPVSEIDMVSVLATYLCMGRNRPVFNYEQLFI